MLLKYLCINGCGHAPQRGTNAGVLEDVLHWLWPLTARATAKRAAVLREPASESPGRLKTHIASGTPSVPDPIGLCGTHECALLISSQIDADTTGPQTTL